jgi:hypothetical protein
MSDRNRGQTTLDFTIGVTIFVVVLAGVFLFVPGTLEPFEEGGQEDIVTVNRVGDQLTEHLLATPTEPYILDEECAVTFFEDPPSSPSECEYSGGSLQTRIGHGDFQFVNVSIRGSVSGSSNVEQLCYDSANPDGSRLESGSDCGEPADTRLTVGSNPAGVQSSVTARRVVELDGQEVFLVVKLW